MGIGGKKTFKQSEQIKKKIEEKKLFLHGNFTPFMSKSCKIWDHFLPLLFPKDSEDLKSLENGLWEVGEKRLLKRVRKADTKKILLSKAKFTQKNKKKFVGPFTPLIS